MPSPSDGNGGEAGAGVAQTVEGAGIGRGLDDDDVTGIEEGAPDQVHGLLGARGDQQLPGLWAVAEASGHHVEDGVAQRRVTLRCAVLEDRSAVAREHVGARREALDRKGVGIGKAAGKGDHAGLLDHPEELADRRGLHLFGKG